MAIVTIPECLTVTGKAVTQDQLERAQIHVDIHAEVDMDDVDALGRVDARDLKQLKWAVCFQAAWLPSQVELEARTDLVEIAGAAADGGVTLRDELSIRLAPLARSCLERLSWKRPATTRDRTRARERPAYVPAPGIVVHTDPGDNPGQAADFLSSSGPFWGTPTDE